MKKFLTIILVLAMALSMASSARAAEELAMEEDSGEVDAGIFAEAEETLEEVTALSPSPHPMGF